MKKCKITTPEPNPINFEIIEILKENLTVWISKLQYLDEVLSRPQDAQTLLVAELRKEEATKKIFKISEMINFLEKTKTN